MDMQEAAQKLAALMNEIGAAGIEIEPAIGCLTLSTETVPFGASVEPVNTGAMTAGSTAWKAR